MLSKRETQEYTEKLLQSGVREKSIPAILESINDGLKEPLELHKSIKKLESSLQVNSEFSKRRMLTSEGYEKGSVTHVPEHNAVRYWHTDGYGRVVQDILTREVLEEMLKKLDHFERIGDEE
ncbi:hypothetical protein LC76P1_00117 [Lysinibacillus phage LC76P1]|nr:hypothetical protein LC76P1_00117 [Lysinibacillus phage LC76P1]